MQPVTLAFFVINRMRGEPSKTRRQRVKLWIKQYQLMASQSILLCVLVLCASLLNPISSSGQSDHLEKHVPLFVFGDSLFDPGNNQYFNLRATEDVLSWPYGETFFKYPTGRYSNGRIVPDFIAEFAQQQILPPYLQPRFVEGANFASGGAGVLVETNPGRINLWMQLSYFKEMEKMLRQELGDEEAKNMLMRAVYLFSIGGNDYTTFYSENPNATQSYQQEYVDMVIGNLTNVLQEIYNMGGRKIAFQSVGPLGCLPSVKAKNPNLGSGCAEEASALAQLHNKNLSDVLKNFESQLPGFKYSFFDCYNSVSERINNPWKYGFEEGMVACCGSGPYRGINCGGNGGTERSSYVVILVSICGLMVAILLNVQTCNWPSYCGAENQM